MKRAWMFLVLLAGGLFTNSLRAGQTYVVVDTGQTKCYDNRDQIAPPRPGQPFYGQDGQFHFHPASYVLSGDGLTVYDKNTALTWQCSPDTDGDGKSTRRDKLTFKQAQGQAAKLNAARFGGFDDWRLPSIKELFSLLDASGTDPSGMSGNDTSRLKPYIDTRFFKFAYGDTTTGERVIDSQWASSTAYIANPNQMFGVNFADGRIKGYGTTMPNRQEKTFFAICVRGNPKYGINDFHDNADGTITDRATGLTWTKSDSGKGMNWEEALAWAQKKNGDKYLGRADWRLPNVKELQSIVDYARSPGTTHSPAIDPLFDCTRITNEGGQDDYPYYWTSTSHGGLRGSGEADYVAFGRASGWMSPRGPAGGPPDRRGPPGFGDGPPPDAPPGAPGPGQGPPGAGPPDEGPAGTGEGQASGGDYHFEDVHGAGAQRCEPKAGDPARFPHGHGPQGDVVRILNFVRLVRGGE